MKVEKEMWTVADVAPLLGVTSGRVYQLVAEGAIPAIRLGGAIRIPRAAWEAWLRDQAERALASDRRAGDTEPARPTT
jgi:excisionase family DNA binding protein